MRSRVQTVLHLDSDQRFDLPTRDGVWSVWSVTYDPTTDSAVYTATCMLGGPIGAQRMFVRQTFSRDRCVPERVRGACYAVANGVEPGVEPMHLGAVVIDVDGREWVRAHRGKVSPWMRVPRGDDGVEPPWRYWTGIEVA